MSNLEGVTYLRLISAFSGDTTKNGAMTGDEVDKNFYFLRGYDIASMEMDDDGNLVVRRVNDELDPIVIKINDERDDSSATVTVIDKPSFSFDKETGIITVTYSDGETSTIEGFLTEGDIENSEREEIISSEIFTKDTIIGDGTLYSPLELNPVTKTGAYAPADTYVEGSIFDVDPSLHGKGYRVVTKETINYFGLLYPYSGVEEIKKDISDMDSEWRVPTKEDWDELLTACEPCYECTNEEDYIPHTSSGVNVYLGDHAGAVLKSAGLNLWKDSGDISNEGEDSVGMTILPAGRGGKIGEILEDDKDTEGFGKIAEFWTDTAVGDSTNFYTKSFLFDSAKVRQDSDSCDCRLSLRLCKEFSGNNYSEIEEILGSPVPCELINIISDSGDVYTKIWTKVNVNFTDPKYSGITSEEWAVSATGLEEKDVYFINEWDGVKWYRTFITPGETIVIRDKDGIEEHEWKCTNDGLFDTSLIFNGALTSSGINVSLKIADDEKVLFQSSNGLETELTLKFDKAENTIKLLGKDGCYISSIDAKEFIVDGMIEDVYLDSRTNEFVFIWKTTEGLKEVRVDASSFVDTYSVAETSKTYLSLKNNEFSAKVDIVSGLASYNKLVAAQDEIEALRIALSGANAQIAALEDALSNSNERIKALESAATNITTTIKSVVANYINVQGTDSEIKVSTVDKGYNLNINIGFADNAIFGPFSA